jgi:serine/threonine-protein kinase RsbW
VAPARLEIDANLERLADVRRFVRETAPGLGADEAMVHDLVQAVDEWVTNVIVHGYRGAGGPIEIELERSRFEIEVRIRDAAPAFDPGTAPVFDKDAPLEHRPLGKMGIHLIRELSDRFERRAPDGGEGGNEVTICKDCPPVASHTGGTA